MAFLSTQSARLAKARSIILYRITINLLPFIDIMLLFINIESKGIIMNEDISKPMKDGVLTATRGILYVLIGLILFASTVVFFCLVGIAIGSDAVTSEILQKYASNDTAGLKWIIVTLLAAVVFALFLAVTFLYKMVLIVKSAGEGDPFVRDNAARLRSMAYAAIGIQGFMVGIVVFAEWILRKLGEAKPDVEIIFNTNLDFPLTGILLFLLLIILARIFDRGADMREELEGTV